MGTIDSNSGAFEPDRDNVTSFLTIPIIGGSFVEAAPRN